jgi:nicotinamidase-related amidase
VTPEIAFHTWRIPERELERHEARRGRRFAYERIDPRRTALVVVDMVSFFVDDCPYARGIIPTINAVAEGLRSADGTVVWVVPKSASPSAWETGFYGDRVAAMYAASGGAVELSDRVAPDLVVAPVDVLVEKTSASALFPGRSALPDLLAGKDITTVVVAGTVTSVCCESTARDASTLGFQVIFLGDATADVSDDAHNAALRTIYRSFGDVRRASDVMALLAADS